MVLQCWCYDEIEQWFYDKSVLMNTRKDAIIKYKFPHWHNRDLSFGSEEVKTQISATSINHN